MSIWVAFGWAFSVIGGLLGLMAIAGFFAQEKSTPDDTLPFLMALCCVIFSAGFIIWRLNK